MKRRRNYIIWALTFGSALLAIAFATVCLWIKGAPSRDQKVEISVGDVVVTSSAPQVIRLWPGKAPGSETWTQKETETDGKGERTVRNVVDPELVAYFPPAGKANGTSVIICPGGGFHMLSMASEGIEVAHYLNSLGITAFILKYRLTETNMDYLLVLSYRLKTPGGMQPVISEMSPLLIADGQQAVRILRANAQKWNLSPVRIGMIGFSAGGYLALNVAVHHTAASRPNFIAAVYPLAPTELGPLHDETPMFVLCGDDDKLVPPTDNSVRVYEGWHAAKFPVELHILAKGEHGFGMKKHNMPTDNWYQLYRSWLDAQGFLPAATH